MTTRCRSCSSAGHTLRPGLRRALPKALLAVGVPGLLAVLSGCGPKTGPAEVVVADSALVGVLADLHVLNARRALVRDDSTTRTSAAGTPPSDSLRSAVLARHGYDEARLRTDVAALDARPDRLALTWASVQDTVDARLRRLDSPAPQ